MKSFIILSCFLALTMALPNKNCIVELGKLSLQLAKLYADVHSGRVPAAAKDILATLKEIQVVRAECGLKEGLNRDIGECIQDSYIFMQDAYKVIQDYETNGVTPVVIDELDRVGHEIPTLVAVCDSEEAAAAFNAMFPPACIDSLDSLAKDGLQIIADQSRPVEVAKDLVRLAKDYKSAKSTCPFIK